LAGGERLVWIAFDLFAATSLIGLLSLNSVDRLANMLVLGFPVIQWLKLASGTLALLGSAQPLLTARAIPNGRRELRPLIGAWRRSRRMQNSSGPSSATCRRFEPIHSPMRASTSIAP